MRIEFLTPWGALVALAALLPLAVLVLGRRRSSRAAAALGLEPATARVWLLAPAACIVAAVALLGVAAAQPVAVTTEAGATRTDAEAMFVLDTSRSMQASAGPGGPTRLELAEQAALRIRRDIADVPSGLASFTDRVLPYLLPTPSLETFVSVLERSVGIDTPPPRDLNVQATTLFALADIARGGYFARSAQTRLLVVLTDGESRPYSAADTARILRAAGIRLVLVRIGSARDRIYSPSGEVEGEYRPAPEAGEALAALADAAGGALFEEDQVAAAGDEARRLAGSGALAPAASEERSTPLARWAVLLALLPLAPLLWWRNLA
jgi:Ca-activated chloride channel family protein